MEIIQSTAFSKWLAKLRDQQAKALIVRHVMRVGEAFAGDIKHIGDGVSEIRIHNGPGYRVYFIRHGLAVVVLLCGGDKDSQDGDIRRAKRLARQWRLDHG
jgi:putative addiction module killer protein